jgi:transposase
MDIIIERACGLDVHKDTVVATVHTPEQQETRTFQTVTRGLEEPAQWLGEQQVTHVAMEATGVYWLPIYGVLEDHEPAFELWVVNARHFKAVPGRKTDVQDSAWLCDLLRHGLLRRSFVTDKEQRERRELVRYRKALIRERANEVNRIQKTRESANIKLGSVTTDIMGASGRQMLTAMVRGTTDPRELAAMAKGRLRRKQGALEDALHGQVSAHQRWLLAEQLAHVDELEARIERVTRELDARLAPFAEVREAVALLDAVPGIGEVTAQGLVAETGIDLSRFPTADHFASWCGLCPGNKESAGKHYSGRTRKGNRYARELLVEAARSAVRNKDSYLRAQYYRMKGRRGDKRAIVAVAHSLAKIVYHMLKTREPYRDLGFTYDDRRNREATARRLTRRLEGMDYRVTIEDVAA